MPSRVCAHCGVLSGMTSLADPHPRADDRVTAAYACVNCRAVNIAVYKGSKQGDGWKNTFHRNSADLEWEPAPIAGRDYTDVPTVIAAGADEAHRVRGINAVRGAVMLARAVVEATAKDKGITQGKLVEKIDALEAGGFIRPATKDAAHELRHAGNDMAHGDFADAPDPSDADDLLTLMDEILEEVYEGPGRVARLRAKRESRGS